MEITYDQHAKAIYIRLTNKTVSSTKQVATEMVIDLDADGVPVGIELLYVPEWMVDFAAIEFKDITKPLPELKPQRTKTE